MTTSIIEVGGMLSALSARGVEKQLMKLPGVDKAEVNYVSGSATVTHDNRVVSVREIQTRVQECGYHCRGELLPKHVCQTGTSQGRPIGKPTAAPTRPPDDKTLPEGLL